MTSRPRSSKTNTFHIGFPSASRMGATGARPLPWLSSSSFVSTVSFRFRIFFREATKSDGGISTAGREAHTYLPVAQRVSFRCHCGVVSFQRRVRERGRFSGWLR